ncbi:MAG: hypothetical protein MRERV_4c042 [Mycoplasmataceae bacterium RV_VA103A]|nr:MAG: hypothetical protein MRERV_11c005 [Mycoplasmataceae bacterium RV_VA103A]KLL05151.1 MAG: hypothetical protein MRERV_4c042 [Mycoplasmataceae bacterium RV_VA103A]
MKVKEMTKRLLNGIYQLPEIEFKKGRGNGWMFKNKRISIHQLEAYLVYHLFSNSSKNY